MQLYKNVVSIEVGDIIVYHAWTVGVYRCMWIGHRFIEKYREGDTWQFKTQGDNAPEPDGWDVPEDAILGKIIAVDHVTPSREPEKPALQTDQPSTPRTRSPTPRPEGSLLQGFETFLLIVGTFCVGAILAIRDHRKPHRENTTLKRARATSCYSCTHYQPRYTCKLESMNGRLGLRKTFDVSKGLCIALNRSIGDGSHQNCILYDPMFPSKPP